MSPEEAQKQLVLARALDQYQNPAIGDTPVLGQQGAIYAAKQLGQNPVLLQQAQQKSMYDRLVKELRR